MNKKETDDTHDTAILEYNQTYEPQLKKNKKKLK